MKYIIDIDGTICSVVLNENDTVNYDKTQPYADRIAKINKLYDEGHEITYWTARGSKSGEDRSELTTAQLTEWGVKYHKLVFYKPEYDIWIDDKAINSEAYFENTTHRS